MEIISDPLINLKGFIKKGFKLARETSRRSTYKKQKLGAVIMYGNKVLATGFNTNKETPNQKIFNQKVGISDFDIYGRLYQSQTHAEISAIRNLNKNPNINKIPKEKMEMFIYRERKDGSFGMARPCPACRIAIKNLGIKIIHYTIYRSI